MNAEKILHSKTLVGLYDISVELSPFLENTPSNNFYYMISCYNVYVKCYPRKAGGFDGKYSIKSFKSLKKAIMFAYLLKFLSYFLFFKYIIINNCYKNIDYIKSVNIPESYIPITDDKFKEYLLKEIDTFMGRKHKSYLLLRLRKLFMLQRRYISSFDIRIQSSDFEFDFQKAFFDIRYKNDDDMKLFCCCEDHYKKYLSMKQQLKIIDTYNNLKKIKNDFL